MAKKNTKKKVLNNHLPNIKNNKISQNQKNIITNNCTILTCKLYNEKKYKKYYCTLHEPYKIFNSCSAYCKHMKKTHGPKYICPFCKNKYSYKGAHPNCKIHQKKLAQKLINSYFIKNEPITFMKKKMKIDLSKISIEKGPFLYFTNQILGQGGKILNASML